MFEIAQWGIVFDHMMTKGVMPHFVLDEQENQNIFENRDGSNASFALSQTLLPKWSRFGYLNAITWNVGEESGGKKITAMARPPPPRNAKNGRNSSVI